MAVDTYNKVSSIVPVSDAADEAAINISVADAAAIGTYKKHVRGTANINVQAIVSGADAAPLLTIYGSNSPDGPWQIYSAEADDEALPTSGTQCFMDSDFPPEYIAVGIKKNSGTTGTIKVTINLKEKTA